MRRFIAVFLLAVLVLTMAACGSSKGSGSSGPDADASGGAVTGETQAQAPAEETEPPKVTKSPADGELPDGAQTASPEDLKAIAKQFIDRDVNELIDAIGQPISSDYGPSCMGSGEDGELKYDGFSVYTYREGGVETVESVF